MSAVQGGFIVLSLGSHCGKPQSQSACSPQLEEEEDHGNNNSTQWTYTLCRDMGRDLESYFLYVVVVQESWL